jgi:cysteine-rich repeat protein
VCGNGVVEDGEECDDGNTDKDDGCDESCKVETDWSCEEADANSASVCVDDWVTVCFDIHDGNENELNVVDC